MFQTFKVYDSFRCLAQVGAENYREALSIAKARGFIAPMLESEAYERARHDAEREAIWEGMNHHG